MQKESPARRLYRVENAPKAAAPSAAARASGQRHRRPDVLHGEHFPGRPSQERSRRARDLLLAAALSGFREHGYEATTVDEITKRAGVAVGAFYRHFRSKRQAMLVLMDRLLEELDRSAGLGAGEAPAALMERFRSHLRTDASYVYRAWREAALRDADLAALHAEIEAWTAGRIAGALASWSAATTWPHDIDAFGWVLSVLFWRAMEAPGAEREALADAIIVVTAHMLE